MSDLMQYGDHAWSYALAFTSFDLKMEDAKRVSTSSKNALLLFTAEKYCELRTEGKFRRMATAENSSRWGELLIAASDEQSAESARQELLAIPPEVDKTTHSLDGVLLQKLLELAKIVHTTTYGPLFTAFTCGHVHQPDGTLDELFEALDAEYGDERIYFKVIALYELANRVDTLQFANRVQAFSAARKIRETLLRHDENDPRLVVAAAWGLERVRLLPARNDVSEQSERSDVVSGLLQAVES